MCDQAKLESLRKLADATNGGQQADVRNSLAALKVGATLYSNPYAFSDLWRLPAHAFGAQLTDGSVLLVPQAEFMKYRSMWIQRKKNVMEGLSIIADGMDKPLKTLIVSQCNAPHQQA